MYGSSTSASNPVLVAGARSMAVQLVGLARSSPETLLTIVGGILDSQGLSASLAPDYVGALAAGSPMAHQAASPGAVSSPEGGVSDGHAAVSGAPGPGMPVAPGTEPSTQPGLPPYAVIQQLPPRPARRHGHPTQRRRLPGPPSAAPAPTHAPQGGSGVPMQVMNALLQLVATAMQAQREQQVVPAAAPTAHAAQAAVLGGTGLQSFLHASRQLHQAAMQQQQPQSSERAMLLAHSAVCYQERGARLDGRAAHSLHEQAPSVAGPCIGDQPAAGVMDAYATHFDLV